MARLQMLLERKDEGRMFMKANLKTIENWFQSCCDGRWEHNFGFSLETTDNPGWIATFQLYTTKTEAESILAVPLEKNDVSVIVRNGQICIYSESLLMCLEACASMIKGTEFLSVDTGKSVTEGQYSSRGIVIGWVESGENLKGDPNGKVNKIVDLEASEVLRVLGLTDKVKLFHKETHIFDPKAIDSTDPVATTLILIYEFPINLVEFPCPSSGIAVYEQRERQFVLLSSACEFHEGSKIAIKSISDEQGNNEIHYWLTIGNDTTAESIKVVL